MGDILKDIFGALTSGEKLKSRKLRVMLITAVIGVLGKRFGVPPELIEWLAQLGVTYIGAQGIADFGAQGLMPSGSIGKKGSVKFLAYILTSIVVAAGNYFEMPPEGLDWLVNIISVGILGQGIADAGKQGLRRLPPEMREAALAGKLVE